MCPKPLKNTTKNKYNATFSDYKSHVYNRHQRFHSIIELLIIRQLPLQELHCCRCVGRIFYIQNIKCGKIHWNNIC